MLRHPSAYHFTHHEEGCSSTAFADVYMNMFAVWINLVCRGFANMFMYTSAKAVLEQPSTTTGQVVDTARTRTGWECSQPVPFARGRCAEVGDDLLWRTLEPSALRSQAVLKNHHWTTRYLVRPRFAGATGDRLRLHAAGREVVTEDRRGQAAGRERLAVRTERESVNRAGVSKLCLLAVGRQVPKVDRAVPTGDGERLAVWRNRSGVRGPEPRFDGQHLRSRANVGAVRLREFFAGRGVEHHERKWARRDRRFRQAHVTGGGNLNNQFRVAIDKRGEQQHAAEVARPSRLPGVRFPHANLTSLTTWTEVMHHHRLPLVRHRCEQVP